MEYIMNTTRVITRIEELDKKRSKIYINHEFAFALYKGELTQYKLETEGVVEDDIYHEITQRVLPKRAKKRCLNLLQKRPYTEFKLREKLKEGYYSQEIIEDAIDYVKSFRYLDDYDYACQYIFYHKEVESRKKMEEKLAIKGISKEVLNKAFGDSYEDEDEQQELELKQARELLRKKKYDAEAVDWKEKQKIYAFLIRKGISVSIIKKAMSLQEDAI